MRLVGFAADWSIYRTNVRYAGLSRYNSSSGGVQPARLGGHMRRNTRSECRFDCLVEWLECVQSCGTLPPPNFGRNCSDQCRLDLMLCQYPCDLLPDWERMGSGGSPAQ